MKIDYQSISHDLREILNSCNFTINRFLRRFDISASKDPLSIEIYCRSYILYHNFRDHIDLIFGENQSRI